MTFLNNGGSAVEAVEMAIRSLEDKEITNAGFGSNLTMHGEVECDATIVDHFGRSGAVGAMGSKQCLHPDHYMSLRRVRNSESYPRRAPNPGALYPTAFSQTSTSKLASRCWSHGLCGGEGGTCAAP